MYYLCKVNITILLFLSIIVTTTSVMADNIDLSAGLKRQKSDIKSISDRTSSRSKSENMALKYKMDERNSFSYTGVLSIEKPYYDEQIIMNENGQKKSLSELESNRVVPSLSNTLEYIDKNQLISTTISSTLNKSPYRQLSGTFGYTHFFFLRTTEIGIEASYLQQKQPRTFFINNDFRLEQRPETIYANQLKIFWEQILSSDFKVKTEIQSSERKKERPRNFGAEVSLALFLSDRLFSIFKGNYITEGKSQTLHDERGYFSLYGADLQITYEPIYDLFVSSTYGICIEEEKDTRSNFRQWVGTDTYGLGGKYIMTKISLYFLGSFSNSNTGSNDINLSGGISWEI
ncbi:MAG: hypothetical protein HQK49_12705 [Oligoflexia bacterium]|nr:hypothetical protein [Oligoflexia bacterium]